MTPALFWPALVTIERAAEEVGKAARVEKRELDQFRRPLAERLEETRTFVEQLRAAGPEHMSDLFDEEAFRQNAAGILLYGKELFTWIWPRSKALDEFPPELRARAAEAIADQQHTEPTTPPIERHALRRGPRAVTASGRATGGAVPPLSSPSRGWSACPRRC